VPRAMYSPIRSTDGQRVFTGEITGEYVPKPSGGIGETLSVLSPVSSPLSSAVPVLLLSSNPSLALMLSRIMSTYSYLPLLSGPPIYSAEYTLRILTGMDKHSPHWTQRILNISSTGNYCMSTTPDTLRRNSIDCNYANYRGQDTLGMGIMLLGTLGITILGEYILKKYKKKENGMKSTEVSTISSQGLTMNSPRSVYVFPNNNPAEMDGRTPRRPPRPIASAIFITPTPLPIPAVTISPPTTPSTPLVVRIVPILLQSFGLPLLFSGVDASSLQSIPGIFLHSIYTLSPSPSIQIGSALAMITLGMYLYTLVLLTSANIHAHRLSKNRVVRSDDSHSVILPNGTGRETDDNKDEEVKIETKPWCYFQYSICPLPHPSALQSASGPITMIRSLILSACLCYLSPRPLAQHITVLIIEVAYLLYLVLIRPKGVTLDLLLSVATQCVSIVYTSVHLHSLKPMDETDRQQTNGPILTGILVIYMAATLLIVVGYIIFSIIRAIIKRFKGRPMKSIPSSPARG
jgi:hypothetical protein